MNTWISKAPIALAFGLSLTGCANFDMPPLPFASMLASAQEGDRILKSAKMMNGALLLQPPEGYCIDGPTLTESFALMGRCDVMIENEDRSGDESDVLTASFAIQTGEAPTLDSLIAAVAPLKPSARETLNGVALVEVTDPEVVEQLDPTHWRGVMAHGGYVIGWAVYAPKGLPVTHRLIDEAAALMVDRNDAPAPDKKIAPIRNSPIISTIAGLFQ